LRIDQHTPPHILEIRPRKLILYRQHLTLYPLAGPPLASPPSPFRFSLCPLSVFPLCPLWFTKWFFSMPPPFSPRPPLSSPINRPQRVLVNHDVRTLRRPQPDSLQLHKAHRLLLAHQHRPRQRVNICQQILP